MTVMLTVPTACAGALAFSCVPDTNVTSGDAVDPNLTVDPDTKLVPRMTTVFPPTAGPAMGLTLVSVGRES